MTLVVEYDLAVRDTLRAEPGLRQQYAAVKKRAGAVARYSSPEKRLRLETDRTLDKPILTGTALFT